jgi:hypothetical protein
MWSNIVKRRQNTEWCAGCGVFRRDLLIRRVGADTLVTGSNRTRSSRVASHSGTGRRWRCTHTSGVFRPTSRRVPHASEAYQGEIRDLPLYTEKNHPGTRHSIMAG